MRDGQDKLRLSNSQNSKLMVELENLHTQVSRYNQENEDLRRRSADTSEQSRRIA